MPGFLDIISLVRAGVGVGLMPSGALPSGDRRVVARPLVSPSLTIAVMLLTLRSRQLTPAASSFIRMTIDRMKKPRASVA